MSKSLKRNNVIAGLFVVVGMVLAVAMAFWVGDGSALLARREAYVVRFTVADGVAGVDEGSPVTLGGRGVGAVSGIALVGGEDNPGVPRFIDVTVEIDRGVRLYDNARPMVVTPLLGTLASINIPDPGGPSNDRPDAALLAPGARLAGSTAPALLAQAGFDQDAIEGIINDVRRITGAFAPEAEPAAADFRATIAALRAFAERVDTKSAEYSVLADEVFADVTGFTGRFDDLGRRADDIAADVQRLVTDARDVAAGAQGLIDRNGPSVDAVIANTRDLTQRLRDTLEPQAERLLEQGQRAVGEFGRLGERANYLVDVEAPGIRRTLGNVRLLSDQAAVFFEELKAAPWRALVRPGSKELAEETLYNAARHYATAVSRLRAASESMESAVAGLDGRGGSPAATADALSRMRDELQAAFDQYRVREQDLLTIFSDRGKD